MYLQMQNKDHKGQIPLSRVPVHLLKGDKDLAKCWGAQRTFPSYLKVGTCSCGHLIPTATQTCRQFPLLKVKSRSHERCRVFHQSSSDTLKRLKLRLSAYLVNMTHNTSFSLSTLGIPFVQALKHTFNFESVIAIGLNDTICIFKCSGESGPLLLELMNDI